MWCRGHIKYSEVYTSHIILNHFADDTCSKKSSFLNKHCAVETHDKNSFVHFFLLFFFFTFLLELLQAHPQKYTFLLLKQEFSDSSHPTNRNEALTRNNDIVYSWVLLSLTGVLLRVKRKSRITMLECETRSTDFSITLTHPYLSTWPTSTGKYTPTCW